MIAFEPVETPVVRAGELDLAGRRVAARALPFGGRAGLPTFGFDPVERVIFRRRPEGTVTAGPADVQPWREALARAPAGPVLVGPGDAIAEPVWGAYRAAADAARLSGRGVYLLDPPLDDETWPKAGRDVVAVFAWCPAGSVPAAKIRQAAGRGLRAGCVFPLLPGWTSDRATVVRIVRLARDAGAVFAAPVLPDRDGASRRAIVEARAETAPDAVEQIFGHVHHGDWDVELADAMGCAAEACAAEGLTMLPPRPAGSDEPAGNAAAAARLEELANSWSADEHRSARARAAVRWIDESARDLSAIAREGNFRRVFAFDADLAAEAERALVEARR